MIAKVRTLLLLGRVSNLPTVWSNCLAGWLLAGGGDELKRLVQAIYTGTLTWELLGQCGRLALLLGGATSMYVGGMFLNDAFDAAFDAQHRRERPIPSGAIRVGTVWSLGFALLAGGTLLLAALGLTTAVLALLLAASIVLYDWIHKAAKLSPVLMALCRFFLYLAAASTGVAGVTGLAVWFGVGVAAYVVGLSYLARKEATGVVIQRWPLALLLVPALLSVVVNDGVSRQPALLVALVFVLWTVRSLRHVWVQPRQVPRAVSGLLAGLVWVDLLAVADEPRMFGAAFIVLFLLAVVFQKFIPAT